MEWSALCSHSVAVMYPSICLDIERPQDTMLRKEEVHGTVFTVKSHSYFKNCIHVCMWVCLHIHMYINVHPETFGILPNY